MFLEDFSKLRCCKRRQRGKNFNYQKTEADYDSGRRIHRAERRTWTLYVFHFARESERDERNDRGSVCTDEGGTVLREMVIMQENPGVRSSSV